MRLQSQRGLAIKMYFSWSATITTATLMTSTLAKPVLSLLHLPQANTELSSSRMIKRQMTAPFPAGTDSIIPARAIVNATDAACQARLVTLNGVAGSPTGMSVCYDVSSLDTTTGDFISQIYLYQVSPATGNWTSIDPTSLNVNIAYIGANLTQSATDKTINFLARRSLQARMIHPVLVTSESFRGRVINGWDPTDQTKQMSSLQPIVTLTARTTSTPPLNIKDTLSPTEAAFVTGAFTDKSSAAAAAAAASTPAFLLPGTTISGNIIFPVGMIVTGIWMVLFVAVVGLGTLGRLQYRNAYRRKARYDTWGVANGQYAFGTAEKKAVIGYENRKL